jgi:autotransporter translocation and assembly factor TamB
LLNIMPEKPKKPQWRKYLFRGFLLLLVLVVVFYQQIFFGIAQLAAQEIAKSQAISLQFKIHGTIVSSLYIEDLHLQPLPGNSKLPLERVDAKWIAVRYNLFQLLKKDFLNVIELVELKNVDVVVRPSTEPSPPPPKNPNGLRIPVVLPKKIDVQDVNLTVRSDAGDLEVNKFALEFQQGAEGNLSCGTLRIPTVGAWNQVHAGLSYNQSQSRLALTGLALEPVLDLHQLQIDLSGSEQGKYNLALDAQALGSSVAATASYLQPAEEPSIAVTVNAMGLELGQIQKLWSIPISGSIPRIVAQVSGEIDRPSSFSGSISAGANGIRYQEYGVGAAAVSFVVHNGKGEIRDLSVISGPNQVRVTGNFTLPDTWNELLTNSTAEIGIAATVSEPERYVAGLNAASLATGSVGLLNGRVQAVFHESVAGISMPKLLPGFSISSVRSNVFAVARFPLSADLWPSLVGLVFTECSNISYQDAHIPEVRLVIGTTDGKTAITQANLSSGQSRAEISTNILLPRPNAPTAFDPRQIAGRLTFNLSSISDFITQNQIEGALTSNGDLRFDHLQVDGTVRASGSQLKYRGMTLQSLGLDAVFKDGEAQIQNFRLGFDPDNYVDLAGSAKLAEPFAFQAKGGVNFKNVAVLNELLKNLGTEPHLSGGLNVNFSGSGDVHNPNAKLQVSGNQLQYRGVVIQDLNIRATAENTKAEIQTCRVTLDPNNWVEIKGTAQLAEPYPYAVNGTIALTDLAVFNGLLNNLGQPTGLGGVLNGSFSSHGDSQHPGAQLQLSGDQFKYRGLLIPTVQIKAAIEDAKAELQTCRVTVNQNDLIDVTGSVGIAAPFAYQARGQIMLRDLGAFNELLKNAGQPADLNGSLDVDFSGKGDSQNPTAQLRLLGERIKYRGVPIQNVDFQVKVENSLARIETGRINLDAINYIDLTGEAGLHDPYSYKANGTIEFKDLGVFKDTLKGLGENSGASGTIHADCSCSGAASKGVPDGDLRVLGSQIKYRGLLVQSVDIEGNLVQRKLDLPSCKVLFNVDNFIDAKGNALLEDPYNYDADVTVQLQDLGFLNAFTKSFGQDLGLAGKLNASWKGNGPLKEQTGNLELHGDQVRTKTVQNIRFDATAHYQGLNAEVSRLQISSPYADLDASIRFNPQSFEIPELNIRRNGNTISGNIKIPLDLQPGRKVPLDLDQPIDIHIQGDKIALDSFQSGKPQVTGTVGFQLQASQALRDPLIQFTASARDIKTTSVSSLSAANADFSVRIADKILTIDGKVQQPDVHPLEWTGRVPLDLGQIIETGVVPEDTPLQFALKWPDNNLAFVRKLVPDIKVVEGTVGADVSVNGTIKRPDLAGTVHANISRFQARTDTVPPIANFTTNITFQRAHIQIAQLQGSAGGGLFGVNGGIDLTDGTNPKFDIGVTGRQVLLTRSDGIIVRANFNLAIRGPLSSGEVSGTVGITDSRFFKDIDVLPLNLPGRPPPQPPAAAMPKIAVDTPPFKDWKFNIAVRTDNPFLVQSNLARGKITINLQAGGTGAAPSLTGFVRIDRLVASLPFSSMVINDGRIDFLQGANILDPGLSIVGRSTVSDYDVTARIFGNVSNPTVLLESSPPLAQGDILVLLATGSPTSAFQQDPSLLAGRATFIVLEQVFRKFFPNNNHADQQKEPFLDRFSVNILPGNRVGEQDIVSSFKLTKNWEIIGDFGTTSYQGRLKYLVRFR